MLTTEQKILAAFSHLGWIIGFPIIAPIIVLIVSKDDFIKTQANESIVFQLVIAGAAIICALTIISIIISVLLGIAGFVLSIIAFVNVLEGKDYSYPVTGKWARNM
jgi:uncharacterized Tic20 family protein